MDNEADDALLTNVTAGSMVQVQVDEDAFHAGTPEVSLQFHDGTDSTGNVIARVVVEIEDKPSTPHTGSAVVDGFADTVALRWAAGPKGNAQPHHYEVSTATGSGFSNSNVTNTNLTIQNARTAVGIGIHTAEVRHCNEAGGYSDALEIPLRVPYSFTPNSQDPLELGEGSPIWTAPSDVTEVFVDVEFSPGTITETAPGDIEIHLLDSSYISLGAYTVDHAADDGALEVLDSSNVQHAASGGSSVRINAGKDAFASAAEMKIKLHSGNDATGDQIAVATVKTQTRPATPINGRSYEQQGSNAVVLEWYPGTAPAGASPHHYEVVIPGAAATDPDLFANLNVPQLTDPIQTVTLTIESARTDPGVGTHTAQVRHCNSAGGCSEPLTILLTVSPSVEITISDLADTTELGASDPFSVTISNLISSVTYNITVTADNANAGFDTGCPDLSKNAPAYTGGTSHSAPFTLYTCGVGDATVTATVTTGTNTLTTSIDVTIDVPTVLSPPTNLQISVNPDENQQLDVTYDLPIYPVHFQFEISRNPIETGSYTAVPPQVDHASPAEFTNMDIGYWYQVRASNCRTYAAPTASNPAPVWDKCGPWSNPSSPYLLRLFAPTGLTITPMRTRQAELSWEAVDGVTGYEVGQVDSMGIFNPGGSWHDVPKTKPTIPMDGKTSTNSIIINLDQILVSHTSYDFQVRAIHNTSSNSNLDTTPGGTSDTSPAVTIIDNPLLQPGGRAYGTSSNSAGQAVLEWTPDTNATNYTIRYRPLGVGTTDLVGVLPPDHTHVDWPKKENWPYHDHNLTVERTPLVAGSDNIPNLDEGQIYAVQIYYETTGSTVFSARDAYIWTSSDLPGNNERVATYPFFGHHENREFNYIICDNTFPDTPLSTPTPPINTKRDAWMKIIQEAFEQWETATNGLVTVNRGSGTCADDPNNIAQFIRTDDLQSEIRMLDPKASDFLSFPEVRSDLFKICLTGENTDACVTSFTGYSGISSENPLRNIINIAFSNSGDFDNLLATLGTIIGTTPFHQRQADNILMGVDVTFNKYTLDSASLKIPSGGTQFNVCLPDHDTNDTNDPDETYEVYALALHEAGHALGLSNINYPIWSQPYHSAHPTIPDSVMNYDWESHFLYDTALENPLTSKIEAWKRFEPDCSPHPFDIMAINALYRQVDRESTTGDTTVRSGSAIIKPKP